MAQMDGIAQHNKEQNDAKKARMRAFANAVIEEYRRGSIDKGLWAIAEEQGIALGTLNRWQTDPDFAEIAEEVRLARKMTVSHKIDRAIYHGEGLQWVAVLLGVLNRIDPVKHEVEHSGQVAHIQIVMDPALTGETVLSTEN